MPPVLNVLRTTGTHYRRLCTAKSLIFNLFLFLKGIIVKLLLTSYIQMKQRYFTFKSYFNTRSIIITLGLWSYLIKYFMAFQWWHISFCYHSVTKLWQRHSCFTPYILGVYLTPFTLSRSCNVERLVFSEWRNEKEAEGICRPRAFLEVQRQTTKNIKENFGVSNRTSPKYLGQFARSSGNENGIIYRILRVLTLWPRNWTFK